MDQGKHATDEEVRMMICHLFRCFGIWTTLTNREIFEIKKSYLAGEVSKCIHGIKEKFNIGTTLVIYFLKSYEKNGDIQKKILKKCDEIYLDGNYQRCIEDFDFTNPRSSACILVPERIPRYGTSELNDYKCLAVISEALVNESFESFVYGIAHEISHIVLKSTRNLLHQSEVATDLTAMILGFREIMRTGRSVRIIKDNSSMIRKIGYLNDIQFEFAYDMMSELSRHRMFE
jgi:hypothetical protein